MPVLNVVLLCVFAINRFVDISYFHSPVCTVYSVCDYYRPITDTAGIVCGPGSMKRSRVRLSVCLSVRLSHHSIFDIFISVQQIIVFQLTVRGVHVRVRVSCVSHTVKLTKVRRVCC